MGGEKMIKIRCEDEMWKRKEREVGGSVDVKEKDGNERKGEEMIWKEDMKDEMEIVELGIILEEEIGGINGKWIEMDEDLIVMDEIDEVGRSRKVMVKKGKSILRVEKREEWNEKKIKGMRDSKLMKKMEINIKEEGEVLMMIK